MKDRTRLKLLLLLIAHAAATYGFSKIDSRSPAAAVSAALSYSQMGLLSLWLVMGTWHWPWRLMTFFAGTAALGWLDYRNYLRSISDDDLIYSLFFGGTELIVAAGVLVARYGWPKARLAQPNETIRSGTRPQFSLQQLMSVVTAVAVVVAIARPIRTCVATAITTAEEGGIIEETTTARGKSIIRVVDYTFIDVSVEGTILLGSVFVSCAVFLASLGVVRPVAKGILALSFAFVLGLLFTYYFAPWLSDELEEQWYYRPAMLTSQSLFTMASLLVVRSCGYRLVSRKQVTSEVVASDFGRRGDEMGSAVGADQLVALS